MSTKFVQGQVVMHIANEESLMILHVMPKKGICIIGEENTDPQEYTVRTPDMKTVAVYEFEIKEDPWDIKNIYLDEDEDEEDCPDVALPTSV